MLKRLHLGIIGYGFVGKAVDYGFCYSTDKTIVDPKINNTTISMLVEKNPDVVFVCVPTPEGNNGEIDSTIVEQVMYQLDAASYTGIVALKSTITPDKLRNISEKTHLRLVYNPEFLTERNALEDFVNPQMHVFGGSKKDCDELNSVYYYHSRCRSCPVYKTDLLTASLVKYTINSFLATKVVFFNQLYDVFKTLNTDAEWDDFTTIVAGDKRIGSTHMKVPGFDGQQGFGGSCFPKDTQALSYFARHVQEQPHELLESAIDINKKYRKS